MINCSVTWSTAVSHDQLQCHMISCSVTWSETHLWYGWGSSRATWTEPSSHTLTCPEEVCKKCLKEVCKNNQTHTEEVCRIIQSWKIKIFTSRPRSWMVSGSMSMHECVRLPPSSSQNTLTHCHTRWASSKPCPRWTVHKRGTTKWATDTNLVTKPNLAGKTFKTTSDHYRQVSICMNVTGMLAELMRL